MRNKNQYAGNDGTAQRICKSTDPQDGSTGRKRFKLRHPIHGRGGGRDRKSLRFFKNNFFAVGELFLQVLLAQAAQRTVLDMLPVSRQHAVIARREDVTPGPSRQIEQQLLLRQMRRGMEISLNSVPELPRGFQDLLAIATMAEMLHKTFEEMVRYFPITLKGVLQLQMLCLG